MKNLCHLILAFVPLMVASTAHAQFSVLYSFGSQAGDPFQPFYSGIIAQGRDGNLYSGSYGGGGPSSAGATFKVTPGGALTTLCGFAGSLGNVPTGGLTMGTDGNFYGTAYSGGFGGAPYGTIFQMTPQGSCNLFYTFTDGNDGALPMAPPIEGADGNYYGTTCPGCNGANGYGTIYKITPQKAFKALHTCTGTDCDNFTDPLVLGTDGNFYGTALYGVGAGSNGGIFRITPGGSYTDLYAFDNTNGEFPIGHLVQGHDGSFYGTAPAGGKYGYGVVFKFTPPHRFLVLHDMNGTSDGGSPNAGLVQATDGNFYGANVSGGATSTNCPNGCGTLFQITPLGVFNVVHNFDLTDGYLPYSTLFQHTNGLIYGMTQEGGTGNVSPCSTGGCGVIYSLNIGASPFVTFVGVPAAKVGKPVEILGQGFTGLTGVSFNGTQAGFTFISDTYITATVPMGATSGSVMVTTPGGTLTSNEVFRVMPQLKTFSPPSGPVGTQVVVTGVSLTQTTKVTFGGVAATSFTVNSDTQVTVTVPIGAKTGKVVVTTLGGSATSATSFTVT